VTTLSTKLHQKLHQDPSPYRSAGEGGEGHRSGVPGRRDRAAWRAGAVRIKSFTEEPEDIAHTDRR